MANLKHALSAFMAVAMVGSLAVNQASNITPASAEKIDTVQVQFKQPEILKGDGEGVVVDQLPVFEAKKTYAQENEGYIITTKETIELKNIPSDESSAIGTLKCADSVTILADEGDYYKVQAGDLVGFIKKDYVTKSYEEAKRILLDYFKFESGYVTADGVNVRDNSNIDTVILDQIDMGCQIFVVERVGSDWMKVIYGENYDIGYVSSLFVLIDGMADKAEVMSAKAKRINEIAEGGVIESNGKVLNVRELPNAEANVVYTYSDGKRVRVVSKGSNWTKLAIDDNGTTAYVESKYVVTDTELKAREQKTQKSTSALGSAIVAEAEKYLGTRYVYGGTSPKGFDCSGLVQYVCKKVGISVNRSSRAQYSNGYAVSRDELQPGDLVFFSKGNGISHVVIYAGDGKVIHSPSPGKVVTYTTLSHICSYSKYVGARRVV